jgi:hypothetical protein
MVFSLVSDLDPHSFRLGTADLDIGMKSFSKNFEKLLWKSTKKSYPKEIFSPKANFFTLIFGLQVIGRPRSISDPYYGQLLLIQNTGVANPHHKSADPYPCFHFNADPDPSFHFNADSDSDPTSHRSDANLRTLVSGPSVAPFGASTVSVHGRNYRQFAFLKICRSLQQPNKIRLRYMIFRKSPITVPGLLVGGEGRKSEKAR